MTEAESVLWSSIKGNALGHKFLRQHIIGDYIVDFFCRDCQLVIEVDGGYHSERTQQEDDAVRQQCLEEMGYKVIRFTNEEVLFNLDKTINTIMFNLQGSVLPPKQGDRGGLFSGEAFFLPPEMEAFLSLKMAAHS